MFKVKLLKITAILTGCTCIVLVLMGSLPGETEGCDSETIEEVDYYEYCDERCWIKAQKEVTECDIFEGDFTEQEIHDLYWGYLSCDDPESSLCAPRCDEDDPELCAEGTFWKPYISVGEADRCLDALRDQSCDDLGTVPPECDDAEMCDPK